MSGTPTPSPETPFASSTPPASRPKRPWTILGRLSQAVREQNWFAVVLEVCIVIVGVVIGFQVTSWGQARSDAAREDALLRQIVADLFATEQVMIDADNNDVRAVAARANVQLIRAFYSNEAPPSDSLVTWFSVLGAYSRPTPRLAGVEALLSGGDRALLGDSTLHVAITDYLGKSQNDVRAKDSAVEIMTRMLSRIDERVDPAEILRSTRSSQELDSRAAADPYFPFAPSERVAFPVDPDELLRDREVYNALLAMTRARYDLAVGRRRSRELAVALREQIQAYLER